MSKQKVIGVRFNLEDAKLIKEVSVARGEDVSDFIRRATRKELATLSFFTDIEKKALGLLGSRQEG